MYHKVAEIIDKYFEYKHTDKKKYNNIKKIMEKFTFYDENMKIINHLKKEKIEQFIAHNLINEHDVVLELGARYGTVSCTINKILNKKTNQVSVEPDNRITGALEYNKIHNKCDFHIVKGFISRKKLGLQHKEAFDGYGTKSKIDDTSIIPSYTLEEIESKYNLKFMASPNNYCIFVYNYLA